MKYLLFTLCLIFSQEISYAANWDLFPHNQLSYYSDNGSTDFTHLHNYTQDSTLVSGISTSYFFNRFPINGSHDQCLYTTKVAHGDTLEFDSITEINSIYFYNHGTDTAAFYPLAATGYFWFVKCPNGGNIFDSVKITCTAKQSANTFGLSDSVKIFLVEAWDNGSALGYYNGYSFSLSKNFGFLHWISFSTLLIQPSSPAYTMYEMLGCEINGNKYGYTFPEAKDYFQNYEPGNIYSFGWASVLHDYNDYGFTNTTHCTERDSITSVGITATDIVINFASRQQGYIEYNGIQVFDSTYYLSWHFYFSDFEKTF